MAVPGLPANIDTTYADSGTDLSVKVHQQHHDLVHAYVNSESGVTRTPEQYGAVGDGTTDDTSALNSVIAASSAGDTIFIAGGKTYRHVSVITINVPGVTLQGKGVLLGSAEATSAVQVSADNVTIDSITFRVGTTTQRWATPAQHKLVINASSGVVVRNVIIDGSAGAGIFVYGASNYLISDPVVRNTRADSIHNTFGANNGLIQRPVVRNSGDDGIAVVSYVGETICSHIRIQSPQVYSQAWGRGIVVVGGQDIVYSDIYVERASAAAVYVACEPPTPATLGVNGVWVLGGTVNEANKETTVDYGAVLVSNGGTTYSVTNVYIEGLRINNTRTAASRNVGVLQYAGTVSYIQLADFTITGGPSTAYGTTGSTTLVNRTGWTKDGTPITDSVGF